MEVREENLTQFFTVTSPLLNERERRLLAAAVVEMLGRGGQARVAEAAGMSRNTLIDGAKELAEGAVASERVRRPGAGRKKAVDLDPEVLVVLESLVEPGSRGDPMSPLRWSLKSTPQALRGVDPPRAPSGVEPGGPDAAPPGLQPPSQRQGS